MTAAVGKQLDILGKYQDVTRSGFGLQGQAITLGDDDFLALIKMAITRNNAQSDLATIQNLLFQNFAGGITVIDFTDMFLSFQVSLAAASTDLIELFITENLLPVPMGVAFDVIAYDSALAFTFFDNPSGLGFSDTAAPTTGGELAYVVE